MTDEPTNDIDFLMSLDPLELSKQDIDIIIAKDTWYDNKSTNALRAERILRLATLVNGCLISHYKPSKVGYPKINGSTYVHRFICSIIKGPIPEGMYVIHSCDNKRCIHPKHISIGTPLDNNLDKIGKGRQGNVGGGKPRMFSLEQQEDMIKLHKQGYSQREIASVYAIDQALIWRYINGR